MRQALNLTRTQVAQALGVSPSTVGGWETGRDPSGETREKYAYFLNAAQQKLRTQNETPTHPETSPTSEHTATHEDKLHPTTQPCVLCGAPATDEVEGYPQHLHPEDCTHPTPPQPEALTPQHEATPTPQPHPPRAPLNPTRNPPPAAAPRTPTPAPPTSSPEPSRTPSTPTPAT
ncbi:helix-turn-helix domain-containing protein [Streptomyces sp. NPDC002176]|uniref:helix-turn-helix domain-containing protein n=1 Tax=Streptomyces sp. NPDC002176 TaxID=3364634 RepID=UPI00384A7794